MNKETESKVIVLGTGISLILLILQAVFHSKVENVIGEWVVVSILLNFFVFLYFIGWWTDEC